jgi:hypothetical protein
MVRRDHSRMLRSGGLSVVDGMAGGAEAGWCEPDA